MYTIQEILDLDNYLLQSVNGGNSAFIDGCISAYVTPLVWLPLAIVLLYVLIKNNTIVNFFTIILLMAGMLALTYLLTMCALQPLSDYLRSLYDDGTLHLLDVLNSYRSGNGSLLTYSAAVTSLALFLMLLVRHKAMNVSLALWAGISCFAGVYMAVYYPWDIVAGILLGVLCSTIAYRVFRYCLKKQRIRRDWVSMRYTRSGYEVSDIYLFLVFMYATFAAVPVISFFL